jgi:hypothetical protein
VRSNACARFFLVGLRLRCRNVKQKCRVRNHSSASNVLQRPRKTVARVTRGAISFSSSKPFRAHRILERDKPGCVTTRMRKAFHEPGTLREAYQDSDPPHPLTLLRPRPTRLRSCCAREERDEVATVHSMTSSARASNWAGMSMPSAFAVLRLITSSYLFGACTGRSAGFSPLRMRSTYLAAP